MTVQLHRFEGFYWVAKEGGFAAAARAFPYPISQPGVHQQVRKLQDELGVPLFERVGHDRMRLTSHGTVLFDFVAPFFAGLGEAIERAQQAKGHLRIDCAQLELAYLVPPWVLAIKDADPEIQVQLVEREYPEFERLRAGVADLAVDHFDELPDDIAATEIGAHRAFFIRPRSGKGKRKAPSLPRMLQELATQPFVSFPVGSRERRTQLSPLEAIGLEMQVAATSSTVVGVLALVRAGLGNTVLPWPTAHGPRHEGVEAYPVDAPGTRFPIHAAYLARRAEEPLIVAALQQMPSL